MKNNLKGLFACCSVIFLLTSVSTTSSFAAEDPTTGSISHNGISVSSNQGFERGDYVKSKSRTSNSSYSTSYKGTNSATAASGLELLPARYNSDSTVPRLAAGGAQANGRGAEGAAVTGGGCQRNSGRGATGRLVPIALPDGDIAGTGSYDTSDAGNFACLPTNAPAGETITVINEETGERIEVEPIVITVSAEDFETQPIKPASLQMDNAPHTLKNYNTNIFAESGEQIFTQNVMGENVEIKAIPVSYTFDYGDGTTITTTNPGSSAGQQWDVKTATSHQYTQPGDFTYTVTTTFRGEFRVPGGPWQVIPGTSNRQSTPATVQVWRVTSGNVADSCAKNPTAAGCPMSKN